MARDRRLGRRLAALAALVPCGGRAAEAVIDPDCWTYGFFSEQCCSGNGSQRGCWDSNFTFERCCGGRDWRPDGYDAWLASPLPPAEAGVQPFGHCAEFAKRFDFAEEDPLLHLRFSRCVSERLTSVRSAVRPAVLAGQHYPTMLAPGPEGLMFALPAYDFVVSKHVRMHGTYDPEELELYRRLLHEGDTVVDVGANVGSYAVPLALHVGRRGLVVAAEPFQALFQLLTANAAINGLRNLRTVQMGLGATEERVRARGPNLESMNNVGMARVFRPFEDKHAESFMFSYDSDDELITVTTLDNLVEAQALEKLSLLKVDVEGHLKAVLAGGEKTLRRFRPVVVAEYSEDDALALLEAQHGYACEAAMPQHDMWVCMSRERQGPG